MALSECKGDGHHHYHECCQLIEECVLIWSWNVVVAEIKYHQEKVPGHFLGSSLVFTTDNSVVFLALTTLNLLPDADVLMALQEGLDLVSEIFLVDEGGSFYQLELEVVKCPQQLIPHLSGFSLHKGKVT
jgi:hypothetical protein